MSYCFLCPPSPQAGAQDPLSVFAYQKFYFNYQIVPESWLTSCLPECLSLPSSLSAACHCELMGSPGFSSSLTQTLPPPHTQLFSSPETGYLPPMPHRVTPCTEQSLELKAGVWQQCRGQFSPWAARNHEMIMKSHTRAVQLASPSLDQLQLSFLETAPGCCRDVFSSLHPSDSLLSKHFLQSPGLGSKT